MTEKGLESEVEFDVCLEEAEEEMRAYVNKNWEERVEQYLIQGFKPELAPLLMHSRCDNLNGIRMHIRITAVSHTLAMAYMKDF